MIEALIAETDRLDQTHHGMSGHVRSVLYHLAAETGQRHGAIRSLTAASFRTDADGDLIMRVVAAHQKNKTKYDVPIPDTLARELAPIIARTPDGKRLFPMKEGSGAEMIRTDLEAAGLAEFDEEGNPRWAFTRCATGPAHGSWRQA